MTILSALGGRSRLPVIIGAALVAIAVTYGLIVGALAISPGDAFKARAGRASHGAPSGLHHSATIAIARGAL